LNLEFRLPSGPPLSGTHLPRRRGSTSSSRYREFVREGLGVSSPWTGLRGALLGSDGFVERLTERLDRTAPEGEFPRKERLAHREPLDVVLPLGAASDRATRNERIRELVRSGRYTAAEVGRHIGLHYSTISRIADSRKGGAATPGTESRQRADSRFKT
jgi:hypothetical protein